MASGISNISEETKKELTRIKGELTAKHGKNFSYDDVIKFLIETYRKTEPSGGRDTNTLQ